MLKIKVVDEVDATYIFLQGGIDAVDSHRLARVLKEVSKESLCKLVFDCSKVPYVTSAGLRVFFEAYRQYGSSVTFSIYGAIPEVRQLLMISGLAYFFIVLE